MTTDIEFNNRHETVEEVEVRAKGDTKSENFKLVCMVLAETIGTALLLFFGCMGALSWDGPARMPTPQLNFGLTVMFIVHIFGHVSNALINPAVTIAAVVNQMISWQVGVILSLAQVIGASIGYGLLMLVTPQDIFGISAEGHCVTLIHNGVSVTQGFFVEFFITFSLVAMICACWNTCGGESVALRIGLTVTTLCIAAAPFTDASLNPARSFGPALFMWNWTNHWVYWVAPMLGGLSASLFYRLLFWKK